MNAVNLIPADARRGGGAGSLVAHAPTYATLGLLAVALAFVTVYVLTSNSIADRQAKLTGLQAQLAGAQTATTNLAKYTQFAQLVQARTQTVRTIAAARFAWNEPFSDLSKVVPAQTSLQTLNASLGSASSASGGGTGGLLASAAAPAIELGGCTKTQDDVARLMSRLRLINGATRVTLASSQKPQTVANVSATPTGSTSAGAVGCGSNAPTFDMLLTLSPPPGAAALGATASSPSTPVPATPSTTTTSAATTTPSTTSVAPGASTTPATGTTSTAPAATSTPGSTK